jgi:hypothetical protein
MAELGLARSLAALHQPAEARKAYATFLASWTHADPDLALLIAAKREAAEVEKIAR